MKTRVIVITGLIINSLFGIALAQEQVQQIKAFPKPPQIGLSCFYGISVSRVIGDGLRKTYFEPTSSTQQVIGQPFGIEMEWIFLGHFGIASGFRHQLLGQNTKKRQVMFSDDIYPHDFQTTAQISYFSVPLIIKGGLMKENYWAFLRLGVVGQLRTSENLTWQIDENDATPGSERMPAIATKSGTSSFLLGCETGIKHNKNGIFLVGDLLHGINSFAYGLPGSAVMQAAEFFIGYRRFF